MIRKLWGLGLCLALLCGASLAQAAEERGPVKLIDRGPYAEALIKKGLLEVSDPELECLNCADDKVLDKYWKDLYKYTPKPMGG